MPLPAQLYADENKDLLVAARIDGELFALKYKRRNYHVLDQANVDLNIYSEPKSRRALYATAVLVACRLQLNPSEDDLLKYGMAEMRDALLVFSRYLMDSEYDISPKIGDRVDHTFTDADGTSATEQYEIKDMKTTDHFRDTGYFMRYVCGASKTTKALEP